MDEALADGDFDADDSGDVVALAERFRAIENYYATQFDAERAQLQHSVDANRGDVRRALTLLGIGVYRDAERSMRLTQLAYNHYAAALDAATGDEDADTLRNWAVGAHRSMSAIQRHYRVQWARMNDLGTAIEDAGYAVPQIVFDLADHSTKMIGEWLRARRDATFMYDMITEREK